MKSSSYFKRKQQLPIIIIIYKNDHFNHFPSLTTCQTLMCPSLNPAKIFLPRGFQTRAVQAAGLDFLDLAAELSFLMGSTVKSTMGFSRSHPKSQTLTPDSRAAETHYNLGLN